MNDDTKQTWMISSSPHAHSGDSVQRIMLSVIVALVPALVAACVFFGLNALRLVAVCVSTCIISEMIVRRLMGRDPGISDLSAVVTGILLAFNLPPGLPSWMAAIGSAFAIIIAKQVYGGLGFNVFNPALIGRAFLLVAFAGPMTTRWLLPSLDFTSLDGITTATPLGVWKEAMKSGADVAGVNTQYSLVDLFIGNRPGCIGETSALALLIGGIYLLYRRCISWHTPVAFIGTVAIFAGILYIHDPLRNMNPLLHILNGGLLLGALFMATDMVTTPVTGSGMFVFGIGCGLLTILIRRWGGYPEGVSFAILIMNALTPLINRATRPRVFGHKTSAK